MVSLAVASAVLSRLICERERHELNHYGRDVPHKRQPEAHFPAYANAGILKLSYAHSKL